MAKRYGLDPGQRRLGRGLAGAEEAWKPCPPGRLGSDDRARNRAEPPVQRQLADRGVLGERLRRDLARGGEHGQRDRQVVARALLAQPGRREVDRDAPKRPLELRARDSGSDSLLGLLTGLVRQPDDREGRYAALEVGLDLDRPRVETDEGMGDGARKHCFEARAVTRMGDARFCADFVPAVLLEGDALDVPTGDGDCLEPNVEPCQLRMERQPGFGRPADAARLLRADGFHRSAVVGPVRALTSQTVTVRPRRTTMSSS